MSLLLLLSPTNSEYLGCTSLSCGNKNGVESKAFFTYYENFPFCCRNSPNYDKSIDDCSNGLNIIVILITFE